MENILQLFFEELGNFEFNKDTKKYRKEVAKTGLFTSADGKQWNITEAFFDELVKNFDVTKDIPVPKGHAGMADPALNTGFVRGLERVGNKLYALFEITEPEISEKIDNNTIKHVSIGVVIRQGVGKVLEHIALTLKPAIPNLSSFEPAMFEQFFEQIKNEPVIKKTTEGRRFMTPEEIKELQEKTAKLELEKAEMEKQKIELEEKNKVLFEAQVEADINSLIVSKKLKPAQKDLAKKLMIAGQGETVKALFEQNDSLLEPTNKKEVKRSSTGKGVKLYKASEIERMAQFEIEDLMKKSENKEVAFVSDADYVRFEQSLPKDEQGRAEFTEYASALSQLNTGSFFLPKLWESKIIRAVNDGNYGLDAIAVPATRADGYTIQWQVVGTLAAAGGRAGLGTTTGTTGMTISTVTASPLRYGNSVRWEGEVNDWSVSNIANSVVYPLLLDDYRGLRNSLALTALNAASAAMDAQTVCGGTFGIGTTNLHKIGTFNDEGALTLANCLTAATLLRTNRARKFPDNTYVCIATPEQLYSIQQGTGWTNVADYADSTRLISGEIGKCLGIRFVDDDSMASTVGTYTAGAAGTGTAYTALMVGAEALGKGFSNEISVKYYDDDLQDNGYIKRMQYNFTGAYVRLKTTDVIKIKTTKANIFY
jgi:N4-gp56 family major capsid protein